MRMWKWLVMKSKAQHGWTEVKAKYGHDNTWRVGTHTLIKVGYMKIDYPRHRAILNSYLSGDPVIEPHHYDPFAPGWTGVEAYGEDWTSAREKALQRSDGKCDVCGTDQSVEVHHVKARKRGGSNVLSNLIPLCRTCHRRAESPASKVYDRVREILMELDSGEPGALKGARPVRGEVL